MSNVTEHKKRFFEFTDEQRINWLRLYRSQNVGPKTFRDLQTRCDSASPSVLNTRLKELRSVDLVGKSAEGYILTGTGRELFERLEPLGDWAVEPERSGELA